VTICDTRHHVYYRGSRNPPSPRTLTSYMDEPNEFHHFLILHRRWWSGWKNVSKTKWGSFLEYNIVRPSSETTFSRTILRYSNVKIFFLQYFSCCVNWRYFFSGEHFCTNVLKRFWNEATIFWQKIFLSFLSFLSQYCVLKCCVWREPKKTFYRVSLVRKSLTGLNFENCLSIP
jgi:hypothetical protein